MQCIIFCGIQASGKFSYYQQHFFHTHVRISMDLLRTRHREKLFLDLCLSTSTRFVVDNTNPTTEERHRYILPALAAGYEVVCYYFHTTLNVALQRNLGRSGRALIPEKGIKATYYKMQKPHFQEGFHKIFQVLPAPNNGLFIQALVPSL